MRDRLWRVTLQRGGVALSGSWAKLVLDSPKEPNVLSNIPQDRCIFVSPARSWVGSIRCPQDALAAYPLPAADDPRWVSGVPAALDTPVLTLSPFFPAGRLGVAVETKRSRPFSRHPNHPPFAGVQAWMPLTALRLEDRRRIAP